MTPKEKAKELHNKMKDIVTFHDLQTEASHKRDLIYGANLIVDEVLNLYDIEEKMGEALVEYWQEVKQEIEKL